MTKLLSLTAVLFFSVSAMAAHHEHCMKDGKKVEGDKMACDKAGGTWGEHKDAAHAEDKTVTTTTTKKK